MKLLSHLLALFLVGSDPVHILVIISSTIILAGILLNKVRVATNQGIFRKKASGIANNVWAIE